MSLSTQEITYGLSLRALEWQWVVKTTVDQATSLAPRNAGPHVGPFASAHMCSLALRHLDKCLELMLKTWHDWTAEQKTAFNEYRHLYHATNKDLRDALEHEEDRFSGGHDGPYSNKAYEGNDFSPPAIKTKRTERLLSVYVLDQWYDIGEAAEAATNTKLYNTLIDVCERLSPAATTPGDYRHDHLLF